MWIFRRKHQPVASDEARRAVERADRIGATADHLIARERRIIRENHIGPRLAAALIKDRP